MRRRLSAFVTAWHRGNRAFELLRLRAAAAQARGVTLGNPRLAEARDKANAAGVAAADAFAANVRPIIRENSGERRELAAGIARALTARGVRTARGGQWTAVQVGDIVNRPFGLAASTPRSRRGAGSWFRRHRSWSPPPANRPVTTPRQQPAEAEVQKRASTSLHDARRRTPPPITLAGRMYRGRANTSLPQAAVVSISQGIAEKGRGYEYRRGIPQAARAAGHGQ